MLSHKISLPEGHGRKENSEIPESCCEAKSCRDLRSPTGTLCLTPGVTEHAAALLLDRITSRAESEGKWEVYQLQNPAVLFRLNS